MNHEGFTLLRFICKGEINMKRRMIALFVACMITFSVSQNAMATDEDVIIVDNALVGSEVIATENEISMLSDAEDVSHHHHEDTLCSDASITAVKICGKCGGPVKYVTLPMTIEEYYGTSNACCKAIFTTEVWCINKNEIIGIENSGSQIIAAHSWGPLNPDGYTHTCTRCGYRDRA